MNCTMVAGAIKKEGIMEAIFKRKSIRKYLDKSIESYKLEKILRAAMQAPSAGNQQEWEFIVVDDKELLKTLANASPYSGCLKNTPLAIIVLGNKDRMIYPENWEQDLGAVCQNILLEATQLDLGGVWLGVAPLEERIAFIKTTFLLPDNIVPFSIIGIGYPQQKLQNNIDRFDISKIHYNKF